MCGSHPEELLLGYAGRNVVVVQHCRRRLDDVLGGLPGAAEAVVPGHGEVLVAAAAVVQLEHLTGDDRVLLGDTRHKKKSMSKGLDGLRSVSEPLLGGDVVTCFSGRT